MTLSKYSRFQLISPPRFSARWLLVVLVAALAAACAPVQPRPSPVADEAAQSVREAIMSQRPAWSFTGRLAISQGSNAGNARIQWQQTGDDFDIQLSAPITRQSWRLRRTGTRVTLEGLDGGRREGSDAELLLQQATGWRIPLQAMTAWVRGVRAPGPAELATQPDGLPATIAQAGWQVEYRSWLPLVPALPSRLFARQGEASVRLAIETWDRP